MASIDRGPSPSPSTSGKLSKLRLGIKNKSATLSAQSLASTSSDDLGLGKKSSVDGFVDKLRPSSRRSSEDKQSSADSGKRLSRLVPDRLKRRKDSADDDGRRASALSNAGTNEDLSRNGSDVSLNLASSGRSSLLTDDEDADSRPARPSLSPHNSHAGYLTLSSPLIKSSSKSSDTSTSPSNLANTLLADTPLLPDPSKAAATTGLSDQQTSSASDRPPNPTDEIKGAFGSLGRRKEVPKSISTGVIASGNGGSEEAVESERSRDGLGIETSDAQRNEDKVERLFKSEGQPQSRNVDPSTPLKKITSRPPLIDTSTRPETPPNSALITPSTFVTPPTPTLAQEESPTKKSSTPAPKLVLPAVGGIPSSFSSGNKSRFKANSIGSSKLSNAILNNPLTPTLEETKTPGGTLSSPPPSGFFSNWVTVAQQAANQLSSTFNTQSPGSSQKSRQPQTAQKEDIGEEQVIPGPDFQPQDNASRSLAVETLGKGELNLSHLGIAEDSDTSPMTSTTDLADRNSQRPAMAPVPGIPQRSEEDAAARAVSLAYDKPVAAPVSQATGGRPSSLNSDKSAALEHSPSRPQSTLADGGNDIKRSNSIRSRISERKHRRHRASSATTGGTLAAAISSSNSTLTQLGITPTTTAGGHRVTGFAVASSKRNKDFHQLFRSVPEDDYLIEDYSAALQRDILLHGRFYVSEGHVCFSSNILGWVTNLVIAFDEIVSIEKKNTAIVFPNALVIQTLHARNTFASFAARDTTYDLLVGIWKTSHPNLKSSVNGVSLGDGGTGDKTEKAEESIGSDDASEDGSDDVYDEDEDDGDDQGSFTDAGANGSIAGSDIGDVSAANGKPTTAPTSAAPQAGVAIPKGLEKADAIVTGAAIGAEFPGVPTHEPTECADQSTHYERHLMDTTIPAPLGKIYSIWFGPTSGPFMKKWLVDDQKSRELSYEDDKFGLDDNHKTFTYSYIKPLNAPVGPRQTKCIVTATLQAFDLEKAVSVDCSTATPDVPSGNIFTTKTRYCLMWGPGNTTRIIASCTIEWTGKSWLKGPIEKGANDGQTQYMKDIVAALKAAVTTKPPVKGQARGKGVKGRRRRETFDTTGTNAELAAAAAKPTQEANWGLLEPIRGIFGPVVSLVQPLVSSQMIIAILLLLLAQAWFFGPSRRSGGVGFPVTGPQKLAAYEAMWQREEADLWDWLEDRVGLEGIMSGGKESGDRKQQIMRSNSMSRKLNDERMSERQVDEAIRATEERLEALKDAVGRKHTKSGSKK